MRRAFGALMCALLIVSSAVAGDVDKAKIREFLHLPAMSVSFGFSFDESDRFCLPGDIDEAPAKISALEQVLSLEGDKAENWARLSKLYRKIGNNELGEKARQKAEWLFRKRTIAANAAPASTPVRPERSPLPISSTRAAASPT